MVFATAVADYILDHVRFRWPWDEIVRIEAEFAHGQAISPGQGQDVTVAGVTVGEVGQIELEDGDAILGLDLVPEVVGPVYRNATLVMRPRTLGQDQVLALDPGSPETGMPDEGRLEDGDRISLAQTQVNVNTDEVIAMLDVDTRTYLQLLLHAGADGLHGNESDLRDGVQAVRAHVEPTAARFRGACRPPTGPARAGHEPRGACLATAVQKDTELASLVDASSAVFGAIGERELELAASVERLPGALASTRAALNQRAALADEAGPALEALRPSAPRRWAPRSRPRGRCCAMPHRSCATTCGRSSVRRRRCSSSSVPHCATSTPRLRADPDRQGARLPGATSSATTPPAARRATSSGPPGSRTTSPRR